MEGVILVTFSMMDFKLGFLTQIVAAYGMSFLRVRNINQPWKFRFVPFGRSENSKADGQEPTSILPR